MGYRNSKLTFFLKNSLGGNALCRVVATLAPNTTAAGETQSTLQFASRAKRIKNKVTQNLRAAAEERKAVAAAQKREGEARAEAEHLRRRLAAAEEKEKQRSAAEEERRKKQRKEEEPAAVLRRLLQSLEGKPLYLSIFLYPSIYLYPSIHLSIYQSPSISLSTSTPSNLSPSRRRQESPKRKVKHYADQPRHPSLLHLRPSGAGARGGGRAAVRRRGEKRCRRESLLPAGGDFSGGRGTAV